MSKATTIEDMKSNYARNIKIRAAIDSGLTKNQIALKFGVSAATVGKYAKDAEFEKVQKKLIRKIRMVEDMCEAYKSGATLSEIADDYDTSKQNISRLLKMAGIRRSDGGVSKKKREKIAQLRELAKLDLTENEIAERLNITTDVLRNYAYEENIRLNTETKVQVRTLTEDILRLTDLGMTQHEISKQKNISQAYVSKILLEHGRRKHLERNDYAERDQNIIKMYIEMNGDIEKIAAKSGLKPQNIKRILKKTF